MARTDCPGTAGEGVQGKDWAGSNVRLRECADIWQPHTRCKHSTAPDDVGHQGRFFMPWSKDSRDQGYQPGLLQRSQARDAMGIGSAQNGLVGSLNISVSLPFPALLPDIAQRVALEAIRACPLILDAGLPEKQYAVALVSVDIAVGYG